MSTTITAPKLAWSFSACVIFKEPGRPPARQGRSSSKQSRLVWPSENRSALIFPPFGRSKHEKTVSAQGSLLIRTHQISQTAETSPSCPPQTLARVLLHPVLTGLPEPFSCSLSYRGSLQGPKGPVEELYYPLSKWTEGDHKSPQLSCSDRNPTPTGLFQRPGKRAQESCRVHPYATFTDVSIAEEPLRYLEWC